MSVKFLIVIKMVCIKSCSAIGFCASTKSIEIGYHIFANEHRKYSRSYMC